MRVFIFSAVPACTNSDCDVNDDRRGQNGKTNSVADPVACITTEFLHATFGAGGFILEALASLPRVSLIAQAVCQAENTAFIFKTTKTVCLGLYTLRNERSEDEKKHPMECHFSANVDSEKVRGVNESFKMTSHQDKG